MIWTGAVAAQSTTPESLGEYGVSAALDWRLPRCSNTSIKGSTIEEFLEWFPSVSREQVHQVLAFAQGSLDQPTAVAVRSCSTPISRPRLHGSCADMMWCGLTKWDGRDWRAASCWTRPSEQGRSTTDLRPKCPISAEFREPLSWLSSSCPRITGRPCGQLQRESLQPSISSKPVRSSGSTSRRWSPPDSG